jgi:hypothetical protein
MPKSAKRKIETSDAANAAAIPPQPIIPKGEEGVGSKQSRVIAMLQSPAGASIATMMQATDWQPHSVRGFLAGVVRKRLKLNLQSTQVDGVRVYQIAKGNSRRRRSS